MAQTSIEWTDRSINPIRARNHETGGVGHYCELYSSGCAHCYASNFQPRFFLPKFPGKPREPSTSIASNGVVKIRGLEVFLDESKLAEVLRRKKPTKYFWCDMTDMFGSWAPDEWIDKCFAVMALTPQHTHQILTKRPQRMAEYLAQHAAGGRHIWEAAQQIEMPNGRDKPSSNWPMPNVWLGTSVEDQKRADERIPHLLRCPAAVRFLSCEPLLGPLEFSDVTKRDDSVSQLGKKALYGIDWVIVGGESGRGARPCQLEWIESIRNQCEAADVSCFVKQLGSRAMDRAYSYPLKDGKGGDPSEWPADLRVRQFPSTEPAHA